MTCVFCKTSEGTMLHSRKENKNGTITERYKCAPCQRMRIQAHKIRLEMAPTIVHKNLTSSGSNKTEYFDFHEASKESVQRLSSRPFYSH